MKKSFNIAVEYVMYGTISVEAENLEEAMKFAEDNIDELPLPDEPEYVDGSYKIDKESTILFNESYKIDKESTILFDECFNHKDKE